MESGGGGGGQIVLYRSKNFRDRFRKYKVAIDGEIVGRISAGEEKAFQVSEGEHELQLKIDWTGSDVHRLTISPGDSLHFACGGKAAADALNDLVEPSKAWIHLEPIPEPIID